MRLREFRLCVNVTPTTSSFSSRKSEVLHAKTEDVARLRYPRIAARFKRRSKKRPSLRERLHKFANLISILGLAIVVVTFVVKDILRETAKDLLDTLEGTQNILFIKQAVDENFVTTPHQGSIQPMVDILSKTNLTDYEFLNAKLELSQYITYWETALGNASRNYKYLFTKLPKNVRNRHKAEERSVEDISKQLSFKTSDLYARIDTAIQTHHALESVTSDVELFSLTQAWAKGVQEIYERVSELSMVFEFETARADRNLRTFTHLSFYVLFPLGILISILGQLAGVKPLGGE